MVRVRPLMVVIGAKCVGSHFLLRELGTLWRVWWGEGRVLWD